MVSPYIVLTLILRLPGVNGPWLRKKLGISALIKTGLVKRRLSWQQPPGIVFFISHAKFNEHCFNISRDILYSVFYHFS